MYRILCEFELLAENQDLVHGLQYSTVNKIWFAVNIPKKQHVVVAIRSHTRSVSGKSESIRLQLEC